MELGEHFTGNNAKIAAVSDEDWKVALSKCKEHIKWRLRQRTLYGAHSPSNLGGDPIDHYLGVAYEKILSGEWEWKDKFSLSEQMIRIANKFITGEVDKFKSPKGQSLRISYHIEEEFYNLSNPPPDTNEDEFDERVKMIKAAVSDDIQLEIIVEGVNEGKKRREIAEILEVSPKQFDKLKEKLIRKVRKFKAPLKE